VQKTKIDKILYYLFAEMAPQLHLVSKVIAIGLGDADRMEVAQIASQPSRSTDQFSFLFEGTSFSNLLSTIA